MDVKRINDDVIITMVTAIYQIIGFIETDKEVAVVVVTLCCVPNITTIYPSRTLVCNITAFTSVLFVTLCCVFTGNIMSPA